MDKLAEYYFSVKSPASFSSAEALYNYAKKEKKLKVTLKQVKEWLQRYDVYTTTRMPRYKFPRLRTVSYGLWDLAQVKNAFFFIKIKK